MWSDPVEQRRLAWYSAVARQLGQPEVERLSQAGLSFRSEIVTGPGGKQIVLDDSAGNPVELFEPA